jgi:tetratricopeptide (TPR) repeat protein
VLKIDPDNHDSLSGLIEASHGMGEEEKIISAYSNYLSVYAQDYERRKEFIQYLMDGEKYSLAIDEILKYLPYKKDSKKLQKMLAICYRKIEDYPEAIIIYRNLLREDPANEEYVLGFVYCLDKNGEVEQAVSLLEKAQSFFKPSATLLLIFGVLLYRRGDTENALSKFREVLDINPRDWRAYKNIGLVYKKKGMNSMAEKFFTHASRYQPASPGV